MLWRHGRRGGRNKRRNDLSLPPTERSLADSRFVRFSTVAIDGIRRPTIALHFTAQRHCRPDDSTDKMIADELFAV